jgi:hypothetical protein
LKNHLPKKLTFQESFLFPIDTPEGRRDIIIGGLAVIFLLPIGWILNLGARLDVVNRLYLGQKPYFRGMKPIRHTFKRGCISAITIFTYLLPANLCFGFFAGRIATSTIDTLDIFIALLGFALFILGVFTLPGCMTVYACEEDPKILWDPLRAFQRAWRHRKLYFTAWMIALSSIMISFFGLLFFVVGFFFSSVWAWEVVGYAFTVAMYNEPLNEKE